MLNFVLSYSFTMDEDRPGVWICRTLTDSSGFNYDIQSDLNFSLNLENDHIKYTPKHSLINHVSLFYNPRQ